MAARASGIRALSCMFATLITLGSSGNSGIDIEVSLFVRRTSYGNGHLILFELSAEAPTLEHKQESKPRIPFHGTKYTGVIFRLPSALLSWEYEQ